MTCGLKHSFNNQQSKDGGVLGYRAEYTEQGLCPREDKRGKYKVEGRERHRDFWTH